VDENVLAAVIANDEAEALLGVEEFDDAFAFANDLRRHSAAAATAAAAEPAAAAPGAAAAKSAAASATAEAAAITETAAATAAAIATTTAAAVGRALLEAKIAVWLLAAEEIVALVTTAPAAVSLAPFVETHEPSETCSPPTPQTNALGPNGATGHGA
jgi:hypothetical protein